MVSKGWQSIKLGDFVTLQRGHDLPDPQRKPGKVPVMGSFGITGYHDTAKAKGPGVTIGRSGASFGVVSYSPIDYWPLNTALYVINFHGNNEKFAYYFLKTLDFKQYNSGSAQPSLNRNFIHPIPVQIPPLPEQKAIAHILGTLDDKIELNREMNQTLEAIARGIFKSWFVDFDPVRAKTQGRQPAGIDTATAELFPDEFEESALGMIPKGWRVDTLGQFVSINGQSIKKNCPYQTIEYIDISSVTEGQLQGTTTYKLSDAPSRAKRLVKHGDTIWSTVRPNRKSYLFIHKPSNNLVVSTGFVVLTPRSIPPSYLYAWVTIEEFVDYLVYNADGSAYPAVLPNRFADATIVIPESDILQKFENLVGRMRDKIAENQNESCTLASIRDTLLPKLLSGEIRVKEAEKVLETVT